MECLDVNLKLEKPVENVEISDVRVRIALIRPTMGWQAAASFRGEQ